MSGSYKDEVCGTCWHRDEYNGLCRESPPSKYAEPGGGALHGQPFVGTARLACSRWLGVDVCHDCGLRGPVKTLLGRTRDGSQVTVCDECQAKWEVRDR